jgi:hypothetical protein
MPKVVQTHPLTYPSYRLLQEIDGEALDPKREDAVYDVD